MKQINFFCEGQTEQAFCVQVLQPHLFPGGNGLVHTLAVGQKDHRHIYGIGRRGNYARIRKFIMNTIKQRDEKNVFFTTLFDLYALPDDFPGKLESIYNPANPTGFVLALERALAVDIDHFRFIPYLQLHEFETMLFARPEAFVVSFENCENEISQLNEVAASVKSIEHINNNKDTAPSKRIISIIPEYDGRKASAGPDIAQHIGLPIIRSKCPHVDHWLSRLEAVC